MQRRFEANDIEIREVSPTPVAIMKHRDDPARIGDTIKRFIAWRKATGLNPTTSLTFNIFHSAGDISGRVSAGPFCQHRSSDQDEWRAYRGGHGRSRGGFSTKINLKTDFDGHPIVFDLTGGEKGDAPHFPILLGLGPDLDPRAAMGDKGYYSKANRQAARTRGAVPVIPYRSTARSKPTFFPKALYKGRARIEQAVGNSNASSASR